MFFNRIYKEKDMILFRVLGKLILGAREFAKMVMTNRNCTKETAEAIEHLEKLGQKVLIFKNPYAPPFLM